MTDQPQRHRRWVLASRPHGEPTAENFRLEESEVPTPGPGQVLLRTVYLSLDPYMRGRMSDAPSYSPPVAIGAVMVGGTVSRVVSSNHADYQPGDWVLGYVAAATGPVGATVGQIGKIKGCRTVGIAGGAEKCRYAVETLGFDLCLDHRADDFAEQLAQACPQGIDVYYENVGGKVFDAVLPLLNTAARVPVCGLVSGYNATGLPDGPDRLPLLMATILKKRIRMQGFIIGQDYGHRIAEFQQQMGRWVQEGKIKYREQLIDGLDQAPQALIGLLKGENFGKVVIRVAADD
ncbi:NADP-dependent oxidoreductase [Klebsiella pneumoniae]|uniref:NADP-dependent oxidoreductase n=1 Tax=Klebsiella pneumoniae TaxID=573 RepID=UPI00377077EB